MKTVILKLTSAIVIAGDVLRAGSLVEVTRGEARDLLSRGKAELHEHDAESDEPVTSSGGTDPDLHPDLASYNADQEAARAAATAAADQAGERAPDAAQDAQQADQAPAVAGRRRR